MLQQFWFLLLLALSILVCLVLMPPSTDQSSGYQYKPFIMWTPGDHVNDSTQNEVTYGYHPDQPLPFSHKLHAGDRDIPCQFCHSSASKSTVAGIPTVETCMGCHNYVNTDAEPIKQLKESFDKKKPIEWTRVHNLPHYVRFSHQVHLRARDSKGELLLGKTADEVCMACHGPVKEMTTASQYAPLQMGWCVDCHNRIREPATESKAAVPFAPVNCNVCHY
ncbi:MAG: cytochrome c3 family protein [Deltaproteobacteria bacterium]|nr:cytochrome c3 family protein [Deltaproteobacteria bacterium]